MYFPNFLFEFPERIYLNDNIEIDSAKHHFYQIIVQDVLDSLDNDTNIKDHIIDRINSKDSNEKRNLASLIGKMQKQLSKIIFSSWNQIFNKELSQTEIIIYYDKDEKGPYLEFNIKDDVDTYRITERSLGFRWFFVYILLTQFRSYRKKKNQVFFLFDEPASNLHPSAQQELLNSFNKLPKVLYTTHSHYLINPKWLENTFVIKNEGIDYENENNYNSRNTNIAITKYREFASKHPNQTNYFRPILEVLNYRPSNLELVPEIVITEGKNDFYLLNYFQQIIKKEKKPLKIVPGTSSTNLENLISLYLGWAKNFIVLLDSDKEGKKQKNRYLDLFGMSINDRIFTYEDISQEWKNIELEDLILKEDQEKVIKSIFKDANPINKKNFYRAIQELYINEEKIDFTDESLDNLKKVIKFLKTNLSIEK